MILLMENEKIIIYKNFFFLNFFPKKKMLIFSPWKKELHKTNDLVLFNYDKL